MSRSVWSRALRLITAIGLPLICTVAGAMLTTNYKTLRANGQSYGPALVAGVRALGRDLLAVLASPWFLIPMGALALVLITRKLTLSAVSPSVDPFNGIGVRMHAFASAARHDQRFRGYGSVYNETMRICHEMDAFIADVSLKGLPVPFPQSQSAEDWIDLCGDYCSAVGPHLRNGNQAFAMVAAQEYADRYPPRR